MGKIKTLRGRKISFSKRQRSRKKRDEQRLEVAIRDDSGVAPFSPVEELKNIKLIGTVVMQHLIANDPNGVMEAIEAHLAAINKSQFLKEAGVPRSTIYKLFKMKNPTIKTLAKIVHAAHASQQP